MQGGGRGNSEFFGFGDPFAGFGRPGSLFSSVFDGRDPFDDPFFTQPFGGMFMPSMFGRSMFDTLRSPFEYTQGASFLEDQRPQQNVPRGPIIQELDSDEDEGTGGASCNGEQSSGERRAATGSPYIQDPDDDMEEDNVSKEQYRSSYNGAGPSSVRPRANAYTFHSSTVTYGGADGAYYTTSTTRRTGGDGVTMEESKEADKTTGKATHRISRGLQGKGHSLTRKLNSDGRVDMTQTLHNINEDELPAFEEAWKGNAKQHLPGWNHNVNMLNSGSRGGNAAGGLALALQRQESGRTEPANAPARRRIMIE